MAKRTSIHTVIFNGRWVNKWRGKVIGKEFLIKQDAIEEGKFVAVFLEGEHVIHGLDGKIKECNSYGNDPCPPRDKN